ncbi:MAG: 30S ribosomal protein S6 [Bacillota bacterium]|uniref:Small ribosomal subunit protein bS6 n=1 Tax=Thermanaerosceptrum fracticalcis TaxID=1712410 RepID=A0A7G6E4Y8_THEFR|nr:30S ribosomal protein S6 [Thermanaerosceptrum fracticalcis]QNB47142.1 30S ribosomal protein S6 [Thermanaerosceptrum fracticalcis]
MRNYEIMYVLKPDLDEEKVAAVIEKFTKLISANGGEVISTDKWGKRRLAYEINDYREGIYILVNFKGEAGTAQELDRVMKITDEILRFMIIKKDE